MPPTPKDPKIANRESWFKMIISTVLFAVFAYKIIITPITIVNFQFMDLLNLALALFATGMSLAFYFKANDTSNQFYDNTYRFTQDMSEILGRIEAGFGERLRHLDEGFQRLQLSPIDRDKVEKEIEQESVKLEIKEQEKEGLINELMNKANIAEEEKTKILFTLKKKDDELEEMKGELNALKKSLADASNDVPFWQRPMASAFMNSLLKDHIKQNGIEETRRILFHSDDEQAQLIFKNLSARDVFKTEQLMKYGAILGDSTLTKPGLNLARHIFKEGVRNIERDVTTGRFL